MNQQTGVNELTYSRIHNNGVASRLSLPSSATACGRVQRRQRCHEPQLRRQGARDAVVLHVPACGDRWRRILLSTQIHRCGVKDACARSAHQRECMHCTYRAPNAVNMPISDGRRPRMLLVSIALQDGKEKKNEWAATSARKVGAGACMRRAVLVVLPPPARLGAGRAHSSFKELRRPSSVGTLEIKLFDRKLPT